MGDERVPTRISFQRRQVTLTIATRSIDLLFGPRPDGKRGTADSGPVIGRYDRAPFGVFQVIVVDELSAALDDSKALHNLDPENPFFADLREQLLEMARWTRTSLNPSAEDRAKIRLGQITLEQLESELRRTLTTVCRSFHDFAELYAAFPAPEPMPKIQLQPLPWDRQE